MMKAFAAILLFLFVVHTPQPVLAQSRPGSCAAEPLKVNNSLDSTIKLFSSCASMWEAKLREYALKLFGLLALIEVAYAGMRLVMRQADLGEWLGEVLNQILFIGFFYLLLDQSTVWSRAIVDSFEQAAAGALGASGVPIGTEASDIFDSGVNIGLAMLGNWSWGAFTQSLIAIIAGFFVLIAFASIAAAVVMAKVESFLVVSAGVIFMGFGGSRWTKDYAVKILVYAVSVGAKLFMLHLIAGLGAQIVQAWGQLPKDAGLGTSSQNESIAVIVGSTMVLWVVSRSIPDLIQGLINGVSPGMNTGLVGVTANLASAAAGLKMAVAGADALTHAQAQLARESGERAPIYPARFASNMAKAFSSNLGERLSGKRNQADRFAQMGEDMTHAARQAYTKAEREKTARAGAQQGQPSQGPTQQSPSGKIAAAPTGSSSGAAPGLPAPSTPALPAPPKGPGNP